MQITIDPKGFVLCQGHQWRCALGRGGVHRKISEGDGITPVGTWGLGQVFYRSDRLRGPETGLEAIAIAPDWGWCDDPSHADYNQRITLPHPASHEALWREDAVYDVVVEVLYNTNPITAGLGSAIFIHVARPNYEPTEGCIALELNDLLALLTLCNNHVQLSISD